MPQLVKGGKHTFGARGPIIEEANRHPELEVFEP